MLPSSIDINILKILVKVNIHVVPICMIDKYICYVSAHKKYFLINSYFNDTNKLFKTILVTMAYNLSRLLL